MNVYQIIGEKAGFKMGKTKQWLIGWKMES